MPITFPTPTIKSTLGLYTLPLNENSHAPSLIILARLSLARICPRVKDESALAFGEESDLRKMMEGVRKSCVRQRKGKIIERMAGILPRNKNESMGLSWFSPAYL